jgi:hypothetical protein
MESAFGIDHGYQTDYEEIEKLSIGGTLKPLASAFKMGAKGLHGPMRSAGQVRAAGAGQMARKVGQFGMANKKPLAIGAGAGLGTGGAAAGLFSNRRR